MSETEGEKRKESEQKHTSESNILIYSETVICFSLHEAILHGLFIFSLSFENSQISSKTDKEEMQRILTMISHGQ